MLDRGNIIELTFLKLGEVGNLYSDNRTEQYKIADVFMNSKKHVLFWHRAFAFRENDDWFVIDPFSHKYIVPISNYRRKNDIIEIVVFT